MTVFRANKNENYTIMSNYHLRDKSLSLKAKGLLSFMLSLPDDWDYSLSGLVSVCKESKSAIRSTLDELKRHNYLEVKQLRGDKGEFIYEYDIYEHPFLDFLNSESISNMGSEKREYNTFTLELIKLGYIKDNDIFLCSYDELFRNYIADGYSYKELFVSLHYIVSRVIERNFMDEYENKIENKYGYLKSALELNFNRFESIPDELYSDNDMSFQ